MLNKKSDITNLQFKSSTFIFISIYMIMLYILSFLWLLPERIPQKMLPYITILVFYALAVYLIKRSTTFKDGTNERPRKIYSKKDLLKALIVYVLMVNIYCFIPSVSGLIMFGMYLLLNLLGIGLFLYSLFKVIFQKRAYS
jgi:uncharacterized membrane protein